MATTKKSIAKAPVGRTGRSSPTASGKKTTKRPTGKAEAAASVEAKKSGKKPSATIDRRSTTDRRSTAERRRKNEPVAVERRQIERRKKVNRRRQIDPTTCERDYTPAEVEFMNAMDDYKRTSGRMFPTCSEVLEVLMGLGYVKCTCQEPPATPADEQAAPAPTLLAE